MTDTQDKPTWRIIVEFRAHLISAVYYGSPVYLVGSGMRSAEPRDIDLVVEMTDEMFIATYALSGAFSDSRRAEHVAEWTEQFTGQWYSEPTIMFKKWLEDCAKNNKALTRAVHRRVDFKTQPQSYSEPSAVHGRILLAGLENKPRATMLP